MATIYGQIQVSSAFSQLLTGVPTQTNNPVSVPIPISGRFAPAGSGVLADLVDLKYTKTLTLAASPTVLDLTALADIFGGTVNLARVKSITLKMRGAADGVTLTLGHATTTTNAWTGLLSNPGQLTLQAYPTATNDCVFVLTAPGLTGYPVTSTSKLLKLDPGAATFQVDVEITGCSA